MKLEYCFENEYTVNCRIVNGFEREGTKGQYFGFMYINDRKWAIVLMDGNDDPEMMKAESIEIECTHYRNVTLL